MTKLIPSVSYELGLAREKIEQLTERNKELEREISRLKLRLKANRVPLPTNGRHSQPPTQQVITEQVVTEKHYLSSTKASRNRSTQSSQETETPNKQGLVTIERKVYRYQDGILIGNHPENDGWGGIHYLCPTRSSMAKQRPCVGYISEEEYECDSYMSYESPCTRDWPDWPRETNQELVDEPIEEPAEEPVEEPMEKTILELISEKTELNRYIESHLAYTPIRSEVVYDLLSRSLRLAQEIFYDGCRIYFPDIYYREYDGPHEVRFGWKEMQDSFFRGDFSDRVIAGKRYQRCALEYHINNMTWIRNQVCHFQSCTSVCQVDTLEKAIRDVQELAAVFGDDAKALQARALRDELHQGAERELSELETMWLLAELPGARPWQRYQLHSLWKVSDSHPEGELITRISEDLKQKHRSIDRPYWPSAYLEQYRDLLDSWTEHL